MKIKNQKAKIKRARVSQAVVGEAREWFEKQFRTLEKPITWADLVERRFRHIIAKEGLAKLIDDALWLYLAKCKTGISNLIALGERVDFREGFEFKFVDFYRSIIRKTLRKCTGYAEYTKAYREGLRSQVELHCKYCGDIYDPWLGRKRGTFFTRNELFSWPLKCQFCGRLLRTPLDISNEQSEEAQDIAKPNSRKLGFLDKKCLTGRTPGTLKEIEDLIGECGDYTDYENDYTDEIERGGEEE